jgi:phenylacetate-CoA ligase
MRTSGSSGEPLRVFENRDSCNYGIALRFMNLYELGRRPRDVLLEISHKKSHSIILQSLGLFRQRMLSIYDSEESNYGKLCRIRPDLFGFYPSVIAAMARMNMEKKHISLKSVFCGAEPLGQTARKTISESFSCSVFNQYGAEEFGTIAWECPEEHSLHINSNSLLLEIIGSNGKPKESGSGEVAITTLHNKAMPLLRYKIGDYGSLGGECPCGRGLPVLKTLEGRSNDFIVLPSGKKRTPVSIDIMYGIPGVISYQIVQERPDLFVFRHVPSNGPISESSRSEVLSRIRKATLGEKITVEFEEVGKIPKTANGKISTVISKVKT